MRDIIIVPSHYRAEFIYLCLEHLALAAGGREKEVYVFQDVHKGDKPEQLGKLVDVKAAVDVWVDRFDHLQYVERQPHSYPKNPFNFLEAYKDAYNAEDVRYVYLVEDDVMVAKDFFQWHEAIQEKESPFISVGWHLIRTNKNVHTGQAFPAPTPVDDPNAYRVSYRDFSSIGLCWKRENLEPLVRHATKAYYENMTGYMAKAFPGCPVPPNTWTEQAGCITRLLHEAPGERKVVWPAYSRVGHVGISGYHRPNGHKFSGSLQNRVRDLRRAITSPNALKQLSGGSDDVNGVPPYLPWSVDRLHCIQTIPYVRGIV